MDYDQTEIATVYDEARQVVPDRGVLAERAGARVSYGISGSVAGSAFEPPGERARKCRRAVPVAEADTYGDAATDYQALEPLGLDLSTVEPRTDVATKSGQSAPV